MYERGKDFWPVPLSEKDGDVFDLSFNAFPNYACRSEILPPPSEHNAESVTSGPVPGVPETFVMHNVLTPQECSTIIDLTEAMGFNPTCLGGSAGQAEGNKSLPEKVVWVAPVEFAELIGRRCAAFLPTTVEGGGMAGINARFRVFKYLEQQCELGAHQDRGLYPSSAVDEDGELRFDYYQDGRRSLMTCLIYLNEGMEGGHTTFYCTDGEGGEKTVHPVQPERGAAVFFYSNELGLGHLSPMHEGSLVTSGVKYIIRTDVLFHRPYKTWFPLSAITLRDGSPITPDRATDGLEIQVLPEDAARCAVEECEEVDGWTKGRAIRAGRVGVICEVDDDGTVEIEFPPLA